MANELDELEKFLNTSSNSNAGENGVANGPSVTLQLSKKFNIIRCHLYILSCIFYFLQEFEKEDSFHVKEDIRER